MITIHGINPETYALINNELTVTGNPGMVAMIEAEIQAIDPMNQQVEHMPYLYYALIDRGWTAIIDPEDMIQDKPDPAAVY